MTIYKKIEGHLPNKGDISELNLVNAKEINRVPLCVLLSSSEKAKEFQSTMGAFAMQLVQSKQASNLYATPFKPQYGFTPLFEIRQYVNS